jgi:hypothetical protein
MLIAPMIFTCLAASVLIVSGTLAGWDNLASAGVIAVCSTFLPIARRRRRTPIAS